MKVYGAIIMGTGFDFWAVSEIRHFLVAQA